MPEDQESQNAKRYKIEFIVIIALMIIVAVFIFVQVLPKWWAKLYLSINPTCFSVYVLSAKLKMPKSQWETCILWETSRDLYQIKNAPIQANARQ